MDGSQEGPDVNLQKRYEHIKACVERESDLVIKWLTMLIAINAGFFLAYREVYENTQVFWLTGAICASGVVTSGFITFAISAADEQFNYLRVEYTELQKFEEIQALRFPRPFGDEHEQKETAWVPTVLYPVLKYPQIIPVLFAVIWIVAFAVSGVLWINSNPAPTG